MVKRSRDRETEEKVEAPVADTPSPSSFTGVARSVECYNNNGMFRNFRIVSLQIENGVVVNKIYSDPFAQWEAADVLDMANDQSFLRLNARWKEGEAFDFVERFGKLI